MPPRELDLRCKPLEKELIVWCDFAWEMSSLFRLGPCSIFDFIECDYFTAGVAGKSQFSLENCIL